ncbi:MAG: cyclic pyranopterin monophosphate synthase MoaC [Clostridia bacterium]|nr:cyclic pyranopterin monophosphate synthase MoaC [Clostridia bacterium]
METFTHINENGEAIMVDVSEKAVTKREAQAEGIITVGAKVLRLLKCGSGEEGGVLNSPKGDVLAAARIAGIMAVKRTSDIIPLCHPLFISKASVDFEVLEETAQIRAVCTVKTEGKTGVEMEALTGVSAALLTIYDMCKAVSKEMVLSDIHLAAKSGGRSGAFVFGQEAVRG